MGAFIVEDKTINKIVTWIAWNQEADWARRQIEALGYDLSKHYSIEKLAKDMVALNFKAVEARYEERARGYFGEPAFKFDYVSHSSREEILKAMNCWIYQCYEGDEVPNHPLFIAIEKIANALTCKIVSDLPAYQKANWG